MNQELVRCNIVLTKSLRRALQKEANKSFGGKLSMLVRKMVGERYNIPYLLQQEIEARK